MQAFTRAALRTALVACGAIALAGVFAGTVRVLPWLLDPSVPWRVAAPFARGLAAVALEAALLVGWPVGWALAALRLVDSGEGRVLQTLGERPATTVLRLALQGAALALALAAVSLVYGADANSPGRVATELLSDARKSCASAREPKTYVVPFTEMTWLCAPGREPRLVGSAPGAMASTLLTASAARIAGDFREADLDDARILFPGEPSVQVHVGSLTLRGMAPWAHASTLRAPVRSLVLALSAWLSANLGALAVLRRAARTPLGVLLLGAAGPLASLGLMRVLERIVGTVGATGLGGRLGGGLGGVFLLVPLVGAACTSGVAWAFSRVRRGLRGQKGAASNLIRAV